MNISQTLSWLWGAAATSEAHPIIPTQEEIEQAHTQIIAAIENNEIDRFKALVATPAGRAALSNPDQSSLFILHHVFHPDDPCPYVEKIIPLNEGRASICMNSHHGTPLFYAVHHVNRPASFAAFMMLLETEEGRRALSMPDPEGRVPLHLIADRDGEKAWEATQAILAHEEGRRSVSMADQNGQTPLFTALKRDGSPFHVDAFLLMLGHLDADDLKHQDKNGNTLLHVAASIEYRSVEIIEAILKKEGGLDCLHIQNARGQIPLHVARSENYNAICVKTYSQLVRDNRGRIFSYIENNNEGEIEEFLKTPDGRQALMVPDKFGRVAWHVVFDKGERCNPSIADMMIQTEEGKKSIKLITSYRPVLSYGMGQYGDLPIPRQIINRMLTTEEGKEALELQDDIDGSVPFHYTAHTSDKNAYDLSSAILASQQGCRSLCIPNRNGYTPMFKTLGVELRGIYPDAFLLMLKHLQDHTPSRDMRGNTLLHIAAKVKFRGDELCAGLLAVELGKRSIFIQNRAGLTPLKVTHEKTAPIILAAIRRIQETLYLIRNAEGSALHLLPIELVHLITGEVAFQAGVEQEVIGEDAGDHRLADG